MNSRGCAYALIGSLTAVIAVLVCGLCLVALIAIQRGACLPDALVASSPGVLFQDDFSSEQVSKCKGWTFAAAEAGKADIVWSPKKLSIVVNEKDYAQLTWPAGRKFKDYAFEIEAQPASDSRMVAASYGILFGIRDEKALDFYRFGVSTSGQYHLVKVTGGQNVEPPIIAVTPSYYIKPNRAKNRLGVLVEGSKISLYINGNLVNTVADNSIQSGNIGLFVGSGEGAWAQVDFGGVTVTSVEKAKQQWSTRLAGDPVPSNGIWFDDDFSSKMASTDKGWVFDTTAESDHSWSPNKYTIVAKQKNQRPMSFPVGTFKDFAVEIEAQPEGDPKFVYGIVFRYGEQSGSPSYYLFGVQPWSGQEGGWAYYLTKFIGGKPVDSWPVELRPSPHIEPGAAKNRLGVLAEGSAISLYINGRRVKTLSDESLTGGKVGIFVQTDDGDRAQVAFSRMTIYTVEKAKAQWGAPPVPAPGIVYREDFASKEDAENNGWEFGSTAKRDNLWSPNKFSIVVKQKGGTASNGPLYYDTFKDVGIEIEAQPENKPGLSYGIYFGVEFKSSSVSAYIFGITTDGNYYLYKMVNGRMSQPEPVYQRPSAHIKQGASKNRLGVLVEGSTIALYINGQPVKTIADVGAARGGVGVFVTNLQSDQARVDFGRMTIYTVERTKKEWTAPLTALSGVWLNDDFSSQSESRANGWVFGTEDAADHIWSPNKFTITVKRKNTMYASYPVGIFPDFGVEIEAQPDNNPDTIYGIIFRKSDDNSSYYRFSVDPKGYYALDKKVGGKWITPDPVALTHSPYVKAGAIKNRLGVLAEGSKISLYINGNFVKTIYDDALVSGQVGIFAAGMDTDRAQVVFSRFTVYAVEKAKNELGKR